MVVKVKLFGILGQRFPGYNVEQGMDIDIPDGSKVKDLLAHLELSMSQESVVIVNGRVVKAGDALEKGCSVQVFQSVFGG